MTLSDDQTGKAVRIRRVNAHDGAALAMIYAPFVTQSAVSFEYEAPNAKAMSERALQLDAAYGWLVAENSHGECLGYAYAGPFRQRPAYDWAVETSAYLAPEARGTGLGARLYRRLFGLLYTAGFKTAIAVITLPNAVSERFHERLGFRRVGVLENIGYKFDRAYDVAYYQRDIDAADAVEL